jgi:hypothetical protein
MITSRKEFAKALDNINGKLLGVDESLISKRLLRVVNLWLERKEIVKKDGKFYLAK